MFNGLLLDMHRRVAVALSARRQGVLGARTAPDTKIKSCGARLTGHSDVHYVDYGYGGNHHTGPTVMGTKIYQMYAPPNKTPRHGILVPFAMSFEVFRADTEEPVFYAEHIETVNYCDANVTWADCREATK